MLTAPANCQPVPGPAADRRPWLHAAPADAGPGTAPHAAPGLTALVTAVSARREVRRPRGRA